MGSNDRPAAPWVLAVAASVTGQAAHAQCEFNVDAVIAPVCPEGVAGAVGLGANALGHVVGHHDQCGDGWPLPVAFAWSAETGLVTLAFAPGFVEAEAVDVNIHGQVVGRQTTAGGLSAATSWRSGEVLVLDPFPGAEHSEARAIGNDGVIVGLTGDVASGTMLPFIYEDGVMMEIALPDGLIGSANDINERGQVAGWMGTSFGVNAHAFIWTDGVITDLGVIPGGWTSSAKAINDHGQVVGQGRFVDKGGDAVIRSFLWDQGTMVELGTLPGTTFTRATDINNQGRIVGYCHNEDFEDMTPFVWDRGVMFDANDLVCDLEGTLTWAEAITDAGHVVGPGRYGTDLAAVRLAPLVSPADLDLDGVVGILDLLGMLASWGPCNGCVADIDADGEVGPTDLLVLLSEWG